ncbi:MAG: hypothetical protein KBB11_05000 [Bacteroidales bacterium]|nr:hypothetical protein [Bacteroidales bacterium]HOY38579.1 hypothetical protein [Bacteroidales bacterium]HQP03265.1 hypothetical protein [Bacteroidales bacterium]
MKKITVLLGLVAFVFALVSCGGPKADAKKMFGMMKKYTETATKVVEDKKIDDAEAADLNKLMKEMSDVSKKFEDKYKDDKEAEKIFEEMAKEPENEKMLTSLMEVSFKLYECEGFDKLEEMDF